MCKSAPSAQARGMAGRGNPYAFPLPSPRPLAASDPAEVAGLVDRLAVETGLAHRLRGACGFWRSDRGDGDGKGGRVLWQRFRIRKKDSDFAKLDLNEFAFATLRSVGCITEMKPR